MHELHVILKVSERCNLRCTYCYFFFGGDTSYQSHSAIIKRETIDSVGEFLAENARLLKIKKISLIFHGGEPLLMKKTLFDYMCSTLSSTLSFIPEIDFSLQTNGLLLDNEWINLFEKYSVSIGISLDGLKEHHDKYRIDHQKKGTYDRTVEKLKFLQNAANMGRISEVGCLSVINSKHDAKKIYHHLVHDLGLKKLDLLLPDLTHGSFQEKEGKFSNFLCELFDAWLEDDNPKIILRYCSSIARLLIGKTPLALDLFQNYEAAQAITISSDGDLYPDDTLKSTDPDISKSGKTIFNTTLKEFLDGAIFMRTKKASNELPKTCRACCWRVICNGGQMVHRYDPKTNSFDNPSVMCEELKIFYAHVSFRLIERGVNPKIIEAALTKGLT